MSDTNIMDSNLQWFLRQMKGAVEDSLDDADLISCMEFNHDGQLLATGDKGGRIVVFKRNLKSHSNGINRQTADYDVYTTFTSHESEFDYLKSVEIEEKINKIKWLPHSHRKSHYLLSTNDKTIKLWRITQRSKRSTCLNFAGDLANASMEDKLEHIKAQGYVKLPYKLNQDISNGFEKNATECTDYSTNESFVVETSAKHIFANAHAYHINAISVNSDQETFLSADDLRINLWHFNCSEQSFNIVDIKPTNMEDLTEVITAAEFHPIECSQFVYSSSKGSIRLCDMRQNALCDQNALLFEEPDDPTSRSFFSEIISSISDIHFSHCGQYILSRDYLTMKVWDTRMSQESVECYPVHEHLRNRLCALYENDCIFDKFECTWSPDDRYVMTGSYNNFFRVFDRHNRTDVTHEASCENIRYSDQPLQNRTVIATSLGRQQRRQGDMSVECLDLGRKLLHMHWHPRDNLSAVAASSNLFFLQGAQSDPPPGSGTLPAAKET